MLARIGVLALAMVSAGVAADLTPAERQANIDSFEYVWKTVRDRHWEARPGGLDWQAVHDELRPKVEKAGSIDDARAILSSMLDRLHQTHFGIFPAEVYEEFESPGGSDGQPGIDARVLDGHAIVTAVEANSPAAARGVKPGWEILRVDGRDIAPVLKRVRESFQNSTLLDLRLSRAVLTRLSGPVGEPVHVDFLDGAGKRVPLDLARVMPRGAIAKIGSLPPFYFWVESKKVHPDIGYVRFNAFFDPDTLSKVFADAVKSCAACSGFVVDLRGNPGGLGGLAMGVGGWFIDKSGLQLGTMLMRDAKLNFVLFPRPEPFRGPLAVLVDGCSGSTSEIFAGGMKDIHRARIFGTRTAGAALPSQFEMLPNGDGFQYAIANYISQGGQPLEGTGVMPDEEVKLTRRQLLEGQDPVLEAAVRWIEQRKH
jgi:carboxyl-terminal processing protease